MKRLISGLLVLFGLSAMAQTGVPQDNSVPDPMDQTLVKDPPKKSHSGAKKKSSHHKKKHAHKKHARKHKNTY